MFGRSQNAYSSGSYNSGNYSSGNYSSSNNYSSYRQNPSSYNTPSTNTLKLGSYRVREYDSQKLHEALSKVQQFRQITPSSITVRDETAHLSPIELRAEDYFMLRNKGVSQKHWRALESCIEKKLFNKDLLSQDSMIGLGELLSFKQSPLRSEDIERLCNGTVSRYGNTTSPYGNYGYNYQGGNSSYNNNNSSNNMFNSTTSNNNNPFNNSSNNNMSGSTYNTRSNNNNPFTSNNNNTSNNMFSNSNSNNSSGGGNNMFSSRTNDMYSSNSNRNMFSNSNNNPFGSNNNNNNSNNTSNNPFNSNNSSNNMFNNNNNNSSGGNNMFSSNRFGNNNNNNNSNNNNNPFSNNNNTNNPFNNNNNNNNNSSNNMFNNSNNNNRNPFSNNNNNNNSSNNMFNNNNGNNMFNNNNRGGGNNLFNNSNNNNNPFNNNNNNNNGGYNNNFGNDMNSYAMMQMAHLLKQCADKIYNSGNNNGSGGSNISNNSNTTTASLYGSGQADHAAYSQKLQKKYAEWFTDPFDSSDAGYGYKRKNKNADNNTIVIVREGSNNMKNTSNGGSFIKKGAGIIGMQESLWESGSNRVNDSVSVTQHNKFYTSKNQSFQPTPPSNNNNNMQQNSLFKRTLSSFQVQQRQNPTNFHTVASNRNGRESESIFGSNTKNKNNSIIQPNGVRYQYQICCLWGEYMRNINNDGDYDRQEFYVDGELSLNYNPALIQLTELILIDILSKAREEGIVIRKDAELKLEFPNPTSKNQFSIKGTLVQNKINVPKGYSYIYTNLQGWNVTNLIISNKLGSIKWPGSIDIKEVDFEKDISIVHNEVDISGPLEENDKEVTLYSLPKSVQIQLPDEKKAAQQMQRQIKHVRRKTNNQGINLIELDLKNRFYTIRIDKPKNVTHEADV